MEKSYDTHKQEAETETKDRSDAQTAAITSVPYDVSKKLLMYPKKKRRKLKWTSMEKVFIKRN